MSNPAAPETALRQSSRLYAYVIAGVVAGIVLGWMKPAWGVELKFLGDAFIRLIRIFIAPIVFSTIVMGIAGVGDLKKVGRVGGKALLWFEFMTTLALVVGLCTATLFHPGRGLHLHAGTIDTHELDATLAAHPHPVGVGGHVLALIPDSFASAFTSGDLLQVLVVALLCGVAIAGMGKQNKPILQGLSQINAALFAAIGVVMKFAPIGAFGAMAYTIAKHGPLLLGSLAYFMFVFYVTVILFVVIVLGLALRLIVNVSIWKLLREIKNELVMVVGTSSSESALAPLMDKLETFGCAPSVVRLVVPTGYSFNLDGTCIYLTMASMFVAQSLDVQLSLSEQLLLLFVLLLTSKGAAGVTGSGFVTLAATLSSVGTIPVAGITPLLGIDRFMSEARALTNLIGNATATLVVAKWEDAIDFSKLQPLLARRKK